MKSWTKLTVIVVDKHEALAVIHGVRGEGSSECKPLISGHRLTMGA